MSFPRYRALASMAVAALQVNATPSAARAQDTVVTTRVGPPTHTVRRGDTLWDLARAYLRDPFLWPEIYRLNTDVVENPHWIYPGERLVLPGRAVTSAAVIGSGSGSTVFAESASLARTTPRERLAPLGSGPLSIVRLGEVYAAPFVERDGGPVGAGRIVEATALSNVRTDLGERALLLNDEVYITAPAGRNVAVGERFLTYSLGTRLPRIGQVVVPTGVLQIDQVTPGAAPRARLTQQFGRVGVGQRLIALEADLPLPGQVPAAVADGGAATVVWIERDPVLPSLQQYLVLDNAASTGAKVGDELTLVRPQLARVGSQPLPEERIGVAQVVRVTPYSLTALIVGQDHPAIARGTRARITAKMP